MCVRGFSCRVRMDTQSSPYMAQTIPPEVGRYLTVNEVAGALSTDPKTVRRHIWSGRLAAVRFGGAIRISAAALEEFLVPAVEERQA